MRICILLFMSISLYAGHINVGYSNSSLLQFNKKDTMIAMNAWISEIIREDNHTSSFTFYDDSQKMSKDFNARKIDFVIAYGLDFVKYFDKSLLVDGVNGGTKDPNAENLVFIVPRNTSEKKFRDLKHPRVALKSAEEISELYAKYLQIKNKTNAKINFLKTQKRTTAILNVFFNKADAAIVTQKSFAFAKELNPQLEKQLKILYKIKLSAASFGFFHKDFDSEIRKYTMRKALTIHESPRGKQVLAIFKSETVVKTTIKELEPIEKFYKDYLRLKQKHKEQ